MGAEGRIEIRGLSKSFGGVQAVRNLGFTAEPGRVTGFLGPNGSGKTTTLSMLLGLVRPDAGTATIGGMPYAALERPAVTVGSSLSADFHPAHTGRTHLDIVRRSIGAPRSRVGEMLELVGLADAAGRKTGGYSLGMRQRLALAAALLGDPRVILLDEPINGLDPEGIRWIRLLLRHLASEGRTVLLSSHLLTEVQQTVDDVVVIRRGELAYEGTLDGLRAGEERTVLVGAPDLPAIARAVQARGGVAHGLRAERLRVTGIGPEEVGVAALEAGVPLTHLSVEERDLEQIFLGLVEEGAPGAAAGGDHGSDAPGSTAPESAAPGSDAAMEGGPR